MLSRDELPPLSADEAAHGERVAAHLRALIARGGGWLPFSQFMDAALYAPGLGYYMAGQHRFGAGGDFVTAPELSPLFARCLAAQVAELLERSGGGDVVEYGAGSGKLAAGLQQALAELGSPLRRYRIVEVSAALRAEQRARLGRAAGLETHTEWLNRPPREPWQGVVLANEVVDALPVDRFRVTADGCEAIGVAAAGEGFEWHPRAADTAFAAAVAALARKLPDPLPCGYVSEWRPMLAAWVAATTETLARGALLIVDYGLPRAHYYHPSRDGGTVCGFYRHRRVEDVLARPGLQDLTAWVDFSAVADAARLLGLEIAGFATQAHFLAALGIGQALAAAREQAGTRAGLALAQGAATLLLPGEMGERFKVIALTRGIAGPLTGFGFRDLAASL